MFLNNIKVAFRNILKNKFYTILNIAGLSIGITAVILISIYINQELSFDKFHDNIDKIYRVTWYDKSGDDERYLVSTPALYAKYLKAQNPAIDQITRYYVDNEHLITIDNKKFYEEKLAFADSNFFDMFSFETVKGDIEEFLKEPNTIILTEFIAQKYFGNINPVGKIIRLQNKVNLEIVGVIKNLPVNSTFQFNFVTNFNHLKLGRPNMEESWWYTFGSQTFVLLKNESTIEELINSSSNFYKTNVDLQPGVINKLVYQNFSDVHLYSQLYQEGKSVNNLIVIGLIGLLILLLGCINFINLSTARSMKRNKEIGVRKVLGANKNSLMKLFLTETFLIVIIALAISFLWLELSKNILMPLIGTTITFKNINLLYFFIATVLGIIFLSFAAGFYPSLVLASLRPAQILKSGKSQVSGNKKSTYLRKGLVFLQFTISVIFIIATIVINRQIDFMQKFDYGFNISHIVNIESHDYIYNQTNLIKSKINQLPGISSVTASMNIPFRNSDIGVAMKPNKNNPNEEFRISVNTVDINYFDHFGIELVAGKLFSESHLNNMNVAVVTEKTIREIGFQNPEDAIGKKYKITLNNFEPEIIGVVKDCNTNSLHNEARAQIFLPQPWTKYISTKIKSDRLNETIGQLENIWYDVFPDKPFEYSFMNQEVEKLYIEDIRYSTSITFFSILAIFIACLGLLGLTSYATEQRKNEIGLRKTLGASVISIIQLITWDFITIIILANIIAAPIAYKLFNIWIENYAYKIDFPWWSVFATSIITTAIALVTVFWQCYKAAQLNPVESLKYE